MEDYEFIFSSESYEVIKKQIKIGGLNLIFFPCKAIFKLEFQGDNST